MAKNTALLYFNYKKDKNHLAVNVIIDDPIVEDFYFEKDDENYTTEMINDRYSKITLKTKASNKKKFVFKFGTTGSVTTLEHKYHELTIEVPRDYFKNQKDKKHYEFEFYGERKIPSSEQNETEEGIIIFEPDK